MDENRLPELPREAFRPMIAQSVQLEQFLGEELIFCFRNLDGVHTFTTCYGDIYKTVNALRDYVRLLESVCDQWELTGFHRATYEYHAEKLRKIADTLWRRNLSGSKPGTLFSSATAGIVLYIIGIGLLFSFMLETPF